MNLKTKTYFFLLTLILCQCKKNAFKEDRDYEIIFKGTLNSFDYGYKENYKTTFSYFTCTNVESNKVEFHNELLIIAGETYIGDLCGEGSSTCYTTFHLNGKLKYKWSKFRFVLVGEANISKFESNMKYNPSYFNGTFTMQPIKK